MRAPGSSLMMVAALALAASVVAGLACKHSSTRPPGDAAVTPPCDPPASTAIRDGLWRRTETFNGHYPDLACVANATQVDTLLWVGVDFLSALSDSLVTCPAQWACDGRFTIACSDTIDDAGCRYIITAQGGGTFAEDALSGSLLVRARTSGACAALSCANSLTIAAVWIGPPPSPGSAAALRASRPARSIRTSLGWTAAGR